MMHVISTMSKLLKMKNYHAVVAILSSLESAPISRLKKSWELLRPDALTLLDSAKVMVSTESNWKNYRETLQQTQPPSVPYIGLWLQDITFIDDGNKTYFEDNPKLINFDKLKLFSGVFCEIEKYFMDDYPITKAVLILKHLDSCFDDALGDNDAWKISLIVEPRAKS